LRVWVAEQGLHCSVLVGMYAEDGRVQETTAWGVILADAVNHIADALESQGLGPRSDLLRAVIDSFEAEISGPTSDRKGEFVARPA
ncbi:MAG TPA: DUF5076 domain-containing protein, partial [Caulobacteraceae bacterium]|nr:DUF5076 domain-containing protein [Caulobacteraceae bacterium]